MTATARVQDFRDVAPGEVYGVADVAALWKVSARTAVRWIESGRIRALPRLSPKAPYRLLGAAVLALLGDQVAGLPGPAETRRERSERAARARQRLRELATGAG